jgi:hypothetical protein
MLRRMTLERETEFRRPGTDGMRMQHSLCGLDTMFMGAHDLINVN